jgi:hypothetical protein
MNKTELFQKEETDRYVVSTVRLFGLRQEDEFETMIFRKSRRHRTGLDWSGAPYNYTRRCLTPEEALLQHVDAVAFAEDFSRRFNANSFDV